MIELARRVTVMNYSGRRRTYTITPRFRYANDAGAARFRSRLRDGDRTRARDAIVPCAVTIDAVKLPVWNLNGGSQGGNGPLLQVLEFDGYIRIADDFDNIHWRGTSCRTRPPPSCLGLERRGGRQPLHLRIGAVDGRVDVFSLTGTSKRSRPAICRTRRQLRRDRHRRSAFAV